MSFIDLPVPRNANGRETIPRNRRLQNDRDGVCSIDKEGRRSNYCNSESKYSAYWIDKRRMNEDIFIFSLRNEEFKFRKRDETINIDEK